ncbi:MAG: DNA mismatch repair protein, MutS family [uncultured archaeon A07HR60]|nr:MAG: DNA mismatch repair protein, MutS family [uncultured archaeon A07HR60]
MRLEDYWGVGPKTSALLTDQLDDEQAIEAIESANVSALVDAGVSRGRATRILRRAAGADAMEKLATSDTRAVYDKILNLASASALTAGAADRIRVLTPLPDQTAATDRLNLVSRATKAWNRLEADDRDDLIEVFERYDASGETDQEAVGVTATLREIGFDGRHFPVLEGIDAGSLEEAAGALGAVREVDGDVTVTGGADDQLDQLREQLADARSMENDAFDIIDTVRDGSIRDLDTFQRSVIDHIATETEIPTNTIRRAAAEEAVDAADFVSGTLRELVADLESQETDQEESVASRLQSEIAAAGDDVETAVQAVPDLAFALSLGRFASRHELTRPSFVEDGIAVRQARNLFLSGDVQPVSYAVGQHDITNSRPDSIPSGDRVAVVTGANSGGKTTLLETLCSVAVMASMGLPVPAADAEVSWVDRVVFHRRHASFNAGVLESTLRSVVPPLVDSGRTLMLVDEFEAITEPGRAADLLNGLVDLTVQHQSLGAFVTHLAEDLAPLPDEARIDGIFAEGLTSDLELRVDYQPRYGTIGKSTPEFIVSRLVANADRRVVRQGFEELAGTVGEEAVQRTLSDVQWNGDD